jgi:integrase/recombinase XerD
MSKRIRRRDLKRTEAFLEYCAARRLSPHTIRAYQRDLEAFDIFLSTRTTRTLDTASSDSIQQYAQYLSDEKKALGTARRRLAGLRGFYKWAERQGLIAKSPFADLQLRLRRPENLPRPLRASDLRILLEYSEMLRPKLEAAARSRIRLSRSRFLRFGAVVAVEILFATGMRISELAALDVQSVDFAEGTILVHGKGNRQRLVHLVEPYVARLLQTYLRLLVRMTPGASGLIVNSVGRRASPANIRRWIRTLAADCNLEREVTPHRLRHSCATQLLECGVDLRFVQRLLGHRSIATTILYTGVSDASLKAALRKAVPRTRLMR